MKFIAPLFLVAGFALAVTGAGAAPRAAEDPTAVVISTSESAPRVKPQSAQPAKKAKSSSPKKSSQPAKDKKKAAKA